MDAFEVVAAKIFDVRGYWTRIGVKVNLTKEQKKALGNPSMPRPEIDVVAFKPSENKLLIVECKSYLDSYGVRTTDFGNAGSKGQKRFKIFNNSALRKMVVKVLLAQLREGQMLLDAEPEIQFVLVAGKIYGDHEAELNKLFKRRGWWLVPPSEIAESIREFAKRGYENEVVTIVTKILERNAKSNSTAEGDQPSGFFPPN